LFRCVVWWTFTDVSEVFAAFVIRAIAMEAASTSETSVNFYQTTQRNNPDDIHHLSSLVLEPALSVLMTSAYYNFTLFALI
jgi:hypothetical protein